MARRAIIDTTNTVVNVTEWDGTTPWQPPSGTTVLSAAQSALPNCGIGATWTGSAFTPPSIVPPEQTQSIHWAVLGSVGIGTKPARVTRTYNNREYTFNCYVTQSMRDDYLAGKIAIGDYVLVAFADDDISKPIVIGKVYKTW